MTYDIDGLKAAAVAAGARPELESITYGEAELEIVLRSPTAREFAAYLDVYMDDAREDEARTNLAVRCTMWPARGVIVTACDRYALLARELCGIVETMAGSAPHRSMLLATDTPANELEPYGLTSETVRTLLDRYPHRGQLRAVACGEAKCVIKRPSSFGIEQVTRGAKLAKGYAQACVNLVVDSVVWPDSSAVDALLARWPALAGLVLQPIIVGHGSAGAVAARKKL